MPATTKDKPAKPAAKAVKFYTPRERKRDGDWGLMSAMGWAVGDTLRAVEPDDDGNVQTLKIVRIVTLGERAPLNDDGTYPKGHPHEGRDGAGGGIVALCEWPAGGPVTATSLGCREWEKV